LLITPVQNQFISTTLIIWSGPVSILYLLYQVSDKRSLWRWGGDEPFLIEAVVISHGPPGLPPEKPESWKRKQTGNGNRKQTGEPAKVRKSSLKVWSKEINRQQKASVWRKLFIRQQGFRLQKSSFPMKCLRKRAGQNERSVWRSVPEGKSRRIYRGNNPKVML